MPEILDPKLCPPAFDFVCKAIAGLVERGELPISVYGESGKPNTVELRLNGVEIPFVDTILVIYDRLRADVRRQAVDLLREKFDGLDDKVNKIDRMADEFVARVAEELGVDFPEW